MTKKISKVCTLELLKIVWKLRKWEISSQLTRKILKILGTITYTKWILQKQTATEILQFPIYKDCSMNMNIECLNGDIICEIVLSIIIILLLS